MIPTTLVECNDNGVTAGPVTDPRLRVRVDEVLRRARRTSRHQVQPLDLDASLMGSAPWTLSPMDLARSRPLWSPASWFSTLAIAGAVPLVIVYWMLQ